MRQYSELGYGYKINHGNIILFYLFLFLLFPSFSAATSVATGSSSSQDTFTVLLKLLPVTLAHKTHNQLLALLINVE